MGITVIASEEPGKAGWLEFSSADKAIVLSVEGESADLVFGGQVFRVNYADDVETLIALRQFLNEPAVAGLLEQWRAEDTAANA
jgi:hypothetical protein